MRILPEHRVAILQHGGIRGAYGKTGLSLLRYSDAQIVAVIDAECAGGSIPQLTGIPRDVPIVASLREALQYHPQVLVTGIAPPGGALPDAWWQEVKEAVAHGLCVVNGLHTPMANHPDLKPLLREGQWIWDIRQEPPGLTLGSGAARELPCLRVLTVGTDMAIGKMSTSIELHRACLRRGMRSAFIASGQTGIMIAGDGVPLDAIRVDFAAGAVEQVVMRYGRDHDILHIEGQGSLLNPASTATLPLIRGSQPTHLILVHRAGQTHIRSYPHVPIPPIPDVIRLYEMVAEAGGAFAPAPVVGIALNTAHLSDEEARRAIEQVERETGLPCTDVVRYGGEKLVDAILNR
ncbi:MAG: DUF1611 domain-containing protein [Chthonomonadetes bacterium]|nr:DUF1611 domain-containing protein [Chthonomonadetes bacterium]